MQIDPGLGLCSEEPSRVPNIINNYPPVSCGKCKQTEGVKLIEVVERNRLYKILL